jgi:hypothetical protein
MKRGDSRLRTTPFSPTDLCRTEMSDCDVGTHNMCRGVVSSAICGQSCEWFVLSLSQRRPGNMSLFTRPQLWPGPFSPQFRLYAGNINIVKAASDAGGRIASDSMFPIEVAAFVPQVWELKLGRKVFICPYKLPASNGFARSWRERGFSLGTPPPAPARCLRLNFLF